MLWRLAEYRLSLQALKWRYLRLTSELLMHVQQFMFCQHLRLSLQSSNCEDMGYDSEFIIFDTESSQSSVKQGSNSICSAFNSIRREWLNYKHAHQRRLPAAENSAPKFDHDIPKLGRWMIKRFRSPVPICFKDTRVLNIFFVVSYLNFYFYWFTAYIENVL